MNVGILEPAFQLIERHPEEFFPDGVARFAYFAGYIRGYFHALDCGSVSFEGVRRPNFSLFVGRHFNNLHNEHRWGAGHGCWSIIRAEFANDDVAVKAFITLARDFWSKHSGQTWPL